MPRKTKSIRELEEEIDYLKGVFVSSLNLLNRIKQRIEIYEEQRLKKVERNDKKKEPKQTNESGIVKFNEEVESLLVEI